MSTAQVATRLSCFALISAIEADLRRECHDLAESVQRPEILPPDVRERAAKRWNDDHKSIQDQGADTDFDLLDYADFADLAKILNTLREDFGKLKTADVKPIADTLESLAPVRNRVCHSRPLEADDFSELYDFAESLTKSKSTIAFSELASTLTMLRENPRSVLTLSIPKFWSADLSTIPHNLPLPDFDDTGFLGRPRDRKEVSNHLVSPHPVITIVGEGGVGKTALALRCLYDLLEAPDLSRYDAIIWVSLKTKTLTTSGVAEIEESIRSILGLVQAIATELGMPISEEPNLDSLLAEIEEYLATFKVLLTIDNLETLSWQTIRPLLARVPTGSKILITSRIGLGEIELRYALDPLDIHTSVALARRHARSLNLRNIFEAKEETLRTICERLYNNPLLIKWFVSSVAAGADPKSLVSHQTPTFQTAIQFCFENLYGQLSDLEKHICHVLAAASRSLVPAEMNYLMGHVKRDELDWAMNTLHQSSMIKRAFVKHGDALATEYTLAEIASEYIRKNHPPSSKLWEMVRHQLKELHEIVDAEKVHHAAYKYDAFAIQASTREDKIAAAYLRRALKAAQAGDVQAARKVIIEAKGLVPGSSEVFRISGLIESLAENYYEATSEHEASVQLDSQSALARYTFAQHLIRANEFEPALAQIEGALRIDPQDPTLITIKALVLTRLGKFSRAAELYENVLQTISQRTKKWRVSTRDQAAECYRRWAEQDQRMEDYTARIQHLKRSLLILENAFAAADSDAHLVQRFGRVIDALMDSAIRGEDEGVARNVVEVLVRSKGSIGPNGIESFHFRRFKAIFQENRDLLGQLDGLKIRELEWGSDSAAEDDQQIQPTVASVAETQPRIVGTVHRLAPGTNFGFIRDDEGMDWFFHRRHLETAQDWREIKPGKKVSFKKGRNAKGDCAISVAPLG
jgi:LuxR family glucitol operon transcriptional activator